MVTKRLELLKSISKLVQLNGDEISRVCYLDFGRSEVETQISELIVIKEELKLCISNISGWAKPKKVRTPFQLQPGSSYIQYEPYGTVLVIAPWNFPFHLSLVPAIGALAAGNKVIIKTSPLAPNSSRLLNKIINHDLHSDYISVEEGDDSKVEEILQRQSIDFVFFTGSTRNGQQLYPLVAKYMLPIVMELGGQNPLIFHEDGNLNAVNRIVWGKLLNAGQACLAPNHIFVHNSLKGVFVPKIVETILGFYGTDSLSSSDLASILNKQKFDRLVNLLEPNSLYLTHGGRYDVERLKIEPSVFEIPFSEINRNTLINDEIFGPVFSVVYYDKIDDVLSFTASSPSPLAVYLFTSQKAIIKKVEFSIKSGSLCVNDCLVQGANANFPFGGVGSSGIGKYHGYHSFKTFSNAKNVLIRSSRFNLIPRFPPYASRIFKIFKYV